MTKEYKNATFVEYTENTFHNWGELVGAKYGYIAIDVQGEKPALVKHWDNVELEQAEKDLRELGYTLGLEV